MPRDVYSGLGEHVGGRIEFQAESLTYAQYATLEASGFELVPRQELMVGIRAVKEDAELEAISRAAAITNECFERLAEQTFVGRTEKELAWWFESLMHELGADEAAFPVIVGAGPGGAQPHASTSDRVIERGQTVVVDAAAKLGDYCSDCTRTFSTGDLPDELARSYDVCLRAQLAALEAVRPGAGGREVDAIARDLIAAEGLGDLFGHGLGHGLGLEVHELPRLRPESDDRAARERRLHGRAGDLPPGPRRNPDRRPRDRRRGRPAGADHLHQGAGDGLVATMARRWPTSSTPTSSRTACTSRSTGHPGASSSSSTSSPARAGRSCARS